MELFKIGSIKKIGIVTILGVLGFMIPSANAEIITPTLGADSVYNVVQGSMSDYTFMVTDDNNNVGYYKILLDTNKMSTGSGIKWTELSGSANSKFAVTLPHNDDNVNPEVKYFTYTYTMPQGYQVANARVTSLTASNVQGKTFREVNTKGLSGAAIYNKGGLGANIKADFIGNYNLGIGSAYGGAVANIEGGAINSIVGDFIGNYLVAGADYRAYGGAIYNDELSTIGEISGDFISNYITSGIIGYGSAIFNAGIVDTISGKFENNYIKEAGSGFGGVIYNSGRIKSLNGSFVGNNVSDNSSTKYFSQGGVLNNTSGGIIGNITGEFIGNYVADAYETRGGAISNSGTIDSIVGEFIGNYNLGTYISDGGAISNNESGTIKEINGNFIDNYVFIPTYGTYTRGGAIYNAGSIDKISGDFTNNHVNNQGEKAYGGTIYNDESGTINSIVGDFVNNYLESINVGYGSAIYNKGMIDTISGYFENNRMQTISGFGGVLDNLGLIKSISGGFVVNNVSNGSYWIRGGALYNYYGTIENIVGEFIGNYVAGAFDARGGTIYNSEGVIGSITGDFIGNHVDTESIGLGGTIFNSDTSIIKEINGDFVDNYILSSGSTAKGGVIYNEGSIDKITGDFANNYIISSKNYVYGGAVYNGELGTISSITGVFIGNYLKSTTVGYGSAIYNAGQIDTITADFIGNYSTASDLNSAYGGVIYTTKDLNFVADNRTNTFSGNYIQVGNNQKLYEVIYVDSADATLTFNATNNGKFVMDDYTNGLTGYNVKLTGDGTGTFELNNQLKGADVTTENITVDLANNQIDNYTFNTLTSSADTKYELDVDFLNKTADTITTISASIGVVTITDFNVLNDLYSLTGDYKIQILNTQNSDLQLVLSDEIQKQLAAYGETYLGKVLYNSTVGVIKQATTWDDTYTFYKQYNRFYGSIGLVTTNTTNDSIGVRVSRTELGEMEDVDVVVDTLAYVHQHDGGFAEREFNFSDANNVYTVKENLGNTVGKFIINGVADGENKSTIDINYKTGFMVNNSDAELVVNNVLLEKAIGQAIKLTNGGKSTITNVDFLKNINQSANGKLRGGALHVDNSRIMSLSGNFLSNKVDSASGDSLGGAVSNDNYGKIDKIENSIFKYNIAEGTGWSEGGAVWNSNMSTIGDIIAEFDYNSAVSTDKEANGGALYNNYFSSIGNIAGVFMGNWADGPLAQGGAIMNNASSQIASITGNFVYNYTTSSGVGRGGAIYNASNIGKIDAGFTGNYVDAESGDALGGAIYNAGTITSIVGNFVSNYSDTANNSVYGATIYNKGTIGDITGNFQGNYGKAGGSYAKGGAILNDGGKIQVISGAYSNNSISAQLDNQGGAIANIANATITEIKDSVFIGNSANGSNWVEGGAILNWNNSKIGNITADFIKNSVKATSGTADGGAISNMWDSVIGDIRGDFVENYAESRDTALGGAIANKATIGAKDENNNVVGGLFNTSFIGNWAKSENGTAKGGAIYTIKDLNLFADAKNIEIRDNYTESAGVKDDNAIYVDNSNATFAFKIKNNGTILLKDNVDGVLGYNFNVTGDKTGVFYLQNDIRNADVSMGGITLNTINNQVYANHFNSFTLTDTINMAVDVDLANGTMDRISADTYGTHNGTLNVIGMNILSDMLDGVDVLDIEFADDGLKGAVVFGAGELPHNDYQTSVYTPIYKYNVRYEERDDMGYFNFARGDKVIMPSTEETDSTISNGTTGGIGGSIGSTGNASDAFNPAVLGGSTSATVGAVGTMNQAVHYSFYNVDSYMNIPYMERMAMKRRNHYTLAGVPDEVRQLGRYSPLYLPGDEEESVWVKPYTTFESVPLKDGPKVSNISYGTLVGFDSQMQPLRRGWDRVISGYVGYTGASQRYSGVDSTQNGGLLGGTLTLYHGNFFNATTLNVGANVAQNETMYGKDDYSMLMSGIANKTGYNLEFKDGKLILQPSMLVTYTFVNTFDYTNAAGVKIDNKPLHTIQVSPGVKLIGNFKNGWQPYASVNMVWNLMGKYDATANGVKLPEMRVKPYVQYGVGLQKRIKDHFMAYGQAMLHHGGRNGISLTAGFRWALGHKEACNYELIKTKADKKVTEKVEAKKVLKELTAEQKKQIESDKKNSFKIRKNVVSAK